MKAWWIILVLMGAGEVIPERPGRYFNDYAGVVSKETGERLNRELEAFERETSSQIVVVIYPTMQSESSIEDYTVRVAQAWRVGQKGKDNGAVLFVFVKDRTVYLQVGYGLEGAIPDAVAKEIIDTRIVPRFRAGDYDGGVMAGVEAILAAARGEYKGTGRTVGEGKGQGQGGIWCFLCPLVGFLFLVALMNLWRRRMYGTVYGGRGWGMYPPGGYWGGGGWGGGWGGGGGGFSGGGGSFGGGGAGGRW